jgi:hypothetical protein
LFSVASHRNAHGAPQFAIVDGQHRTTAAILRGQEKVPCQSCKPIAQVVVPQPLL